MKGTLFSSDFVKDINGNLRLLEFNTDTGFIDSSLNHFNFTELHNILNSNSITKFDIIYKNFASPFVDLISESIAQNVPAITSFNKTIEEFGTIYPTTISDADDTFILRLAYDESAIFDSNYCSNNIETFKLFVDNSNEASVTQFKYDSDEFSHNNLPVSFNSSNVPDFVVKEYSSAPGTPLQFHKVGTDVSLGATDSERLENYLNTFEVGSSIIQPFYNNENDSRSKSIRTYSIIYGSNLDVITLASFETEALLDKPSSIEFDNNSIKNVIDTKHYYELTTNFLKVTEGGIFEEEEIIKGDGTPVKVSEAQVGDSFQSYIISGSPDSDDVNVITAWSYNGSEMPSGSYQTTTSLVNNREFDLSFNTINHLSLEGGAEFRINSTILILVYDVNKDIMRYENIMHIEPGSFKLVSADGQLVNVVSNDIEILDGSYKTNILDMEESDTYFLKGGDIAIKLITHNCFVEGTLVTDGDGNQVKIESFKPGDMVLSAKLDGNGGFELEPKQITDVVSIKKSLTYKIHVGGKIIEGTGDHPMYVDGGKVKIMNLKVGDKLTNSKGELVEITKIEICEEEKQVYNLVGVVDNRNFFVEDYLLWNKGAPPACFIAGTEITLANGDVKNIEDVVVGEEVMTYNETTNETEIGIVGDLKKHEVTSVIRLTFDNENIITTTEEHPFFVEGKGWVKSSELESLDVCKKIDGSESLVSSVESLKESHIVYNLLSVSENHNFFANGILVHNK